MKYLNIKVNLKDITGDDFHHLMMKYHHVPLLEDMHINHFDHSWMIHDYVGFNHIYAYHIVDDVIYDYIFNENDCCVCISIDKNINDEHIDLLDYFISHDYIDDYDDLYVSSHPFYIDHIDQYKRMSYDIPFVYVDQSFNEEERNLLASLIKGMAVVIYGNDDFDKDFKNLYQIKYNNYILLYNNEHYSIKPLSHESHLQLIERIVSRLVTYSSKRVFSGTYNIQDLYEIHLQRMILEAKMNQKELEDKHQDIENDLMEQKKKLEDSNHHLYVQIERLKQQIEVSQSRIDSCVKRPLLVCGDELELYPGEITDMIKFLLKEEIRLHRASEEEVIMIKEIINDNKTDEKRFEILDKLKSIIYNSGVNDEVLARLAELGFSGDKEHSDHYKFIFGNDPRYTATISSSSGDFNGGRALYRDIKKYIF